MNLQRVVIPDPRTYDSKERMKGSVNVGGLGQGELPLLYIMAHYTPILLPGHLPPGRLGLDNLPLQARWTRAL